ncbi:MAG: hypothetical protein HYT97_06455 [Elusimicrobia bacterium]|nr:hypothetical protein [Elusimicrobiota bacterium]
MKKNFFEVSQPFKMSEKSYFLNRLKLEWKLLLFSIFLTFFAAALLKIKQDGREIYLSHKNALVLEVFSEAELDLNGAKELEMKLKSLDGVKEVISTSPEEAAGKLSLLSDLSFDPSWLKEKDFLPWSYDLHLLRWDHIFLQNLIAKIESLELGEPKKRIVSEIHYDKERWSLVYALQNYLKWMEQVFFIGSFFMLGFLLYASLRFFYIEGINSENKFNFIKQGFSLLLFGFLAGMISALLYLTVLSYSFFPESAAWKGAVEKTFLFQVLFGSAVYFIIFNLSVKERK